MDEGHVFVGLDNLHLREPRGDHIMPITTLDVDVNAFKNTPKTSEDFELANFYGYLANGRRHHFTDTEFRTLHSMLQKWGTTGLSNHHVLDNFNRFYTIFPDMEMPADLKSYIFITRPEMNLTGSSIFGSLANQPSIRLATENAQDNRLQYLAAMNPEIMYMLTKDYSSSHDFIPYLQSRAESLQIPDYQIRSSEFTVPFYSYKFAYPTVTNESITGGSFDITFRDDSDLRIMKMFDFWIYYMDAVMKNKMKPAKSYINGNFFDYMCSVYEIVCDPTSEKILFWAKYTGCFPTSVPLSNLSHNRRSNVESSVSISFQYMMVEAMEPRVIADFNNNSTHVGTFVDVYNEDYGIIGDSLVGNPRIVVTPDQHSLMLQWNSRVNGKSSTLSNSVPTLTNIENQLAKSSRSSAIGDTTRYADTSNKTVGLARWLLNNSDSL